MGGGRFVKSCLTTVLIRDQRERGRAHRAERDAARRRPRPRHPRVGLLRHELAAAREELRNLELRVHPGLHPGDDGHGPLDRVEQGRVQRPRGGAGRAREEHRAAEAGHAGGGRAGRGRLRLRAGVEGLAGGSASPPPAATATTSARASRWRSSTWSMRRPERSSTPMWSAWSAGRASSRAVRTTRAGRRCGGSGNGGRSAGSHESNRRLPGTSHRHSRFGGAYRSRTIRLPNRHAITFPSKLRDCLLRASRESDFGTRRASVSAPERPLPVPGDPCRP